jgi:hypothetical protein
LSGQHLSNDRAAEFRSRAAEMVATAATMSSNHLQQGFLDIAASYQRMAEYIERQVGATIAAAIEKPTLVEGAAVAAAVDPTSRPDHDSTT